MVWCIRIRQNCFKGQDIRYSGGLNNKEASYLQSPGRQSRVGMAVLQSSGTWLCASCAVILHRQLLLVIHMTPSSVTFHIPTSRKGKREGGGHSSFLEDMAHIPWPTPGHMATVSCKGGWEIPRFHGHVFSPKAGFNYWWRGKQILG